MFKFAVSLIGVSLLTGLMIGLTHDLALSDYENCRKTARQLVHSGLYRQASLWADLAMKRRESALPIGSEEDEFFVDDLLSLGKYEQAEKLSRSLYPIAQLYPGSTCNYAEYRQNLHIKALIGLHLYISAAIEAKKLPSDDSTGYQNAGEAFFAIGDIDSAKAAFKSLPKLAKLYDQLSDLPKSDDFQAQQIAKSWISFFSDGESDRIYECEFCEQMMLRKKCFAAAKILSQEANSARQL